MGNSYKVQGTLRLITETKQVSDKFRKREFVLDVQDGKWPQVVSFQVTGDRCELLDQYGEGDELTVEFNLRGREWRSPSGEVKFFNTLEAWRMDRVGAAKSSSTPKPTGPNGSGNDDDSLPF
jgi:hypothetical protein